MKKTIFDMDEVIKSCVAEKLRNSISRVLVLDSDCSYADFYFDKDGKLIKADFSGDKRVIEYNEDGDMSKVLHSDGTINIYEYDDNRNAIKISEYYADRDDIFIQEHKYDNSGNDIYVKQYILRNGVEEPCDPYEIWKVYNEKDQVILMRQTGDIEERYTYTECGNLETSVNDYFSVINTFDENNIISHSTRLEFNSEKAVEKEIGTDFEHDKDGNLIYACQSYGFFTKYYYEFYDKEEAK